MNESSRVPRRLSKNWEEHENDENKRMGRGVTKTWTYVLGEGQGILVCPLDYCTRHVLCMNMTWGRTSSDCTADDCAWTLARAPPADARGDARDARDGPRPPLPPSRCGPPVHRVGPRPKARPPPRRVRTELPLRSAARSAGTRHSKCTAKPRAPPRTRAKATLNAPYCWWDDMRWDQTRREEKRRECWQVVAFRSQIYKPLWRIEYLWFGRIERNALTRYQN